MTKSKPRIFIGPCEVAGYYSALASALRADGYHVGFVGGDYHPFGYQDRKASPLFSLYSFIRAKRTVWRQKNNKLWPLLAILEQAWLGILFIWCAARYDVFIFTFGQSFTRTGLDLWVLKRLFKKKIICNIAHGSEARPPYLCGGRLHLGDNVPPVESIVAQTRYMHRNIKRIETYADTIIAAPLATQFLTHPYVMTNVIGVPVKVPTDLPAPQTKTSEAVTILHAPSHERVKGSAKIRQAIQKLKEKGHAIDYIEITNRPHHEVLEALSRCDFVVDQLYCDGLLAGFGTEAAWFQKPCIVGGYGWDTLKSNVPKDLQPPSYTCDPDDLENAIETLITDEQLRVEMGRAVHAFVLKNWHIDQILERFKTLIHEEAPQEWLHNPLTIQYLYGACADKKVIHDMVRQIIERYGVRGLCLYDRPDMEKAMVAFAETSV